MAYLTVKIIKGNYYLYEQESYRDEDAKVKTKSKYIGPCSASQAIGYSTRNRFYETGVFDESKPNDKTLEDLRKITLETRKRASNNQKSVKNNSPPKRHKKVNLTNKNKPKYEGLKENGVLKSKYYSVSEGNLKNNLKRVFTMFGLDQKNSPEIIIKFGANLTSKKSLTGSYIITTPKQKGLSQRLRTEVLRCGALIGLEHLKKTKNEAYRELEETFMVNHQTINEGLTRFINLTNRNQRTAEAKSFAVKYFGNMSFLKKLSKNFKYSIKPSSLGLVDFESKRKTWQDDFIIDFAESHFAKYDLVQKRKSILDRTTYTLNREKKDHEELPIYQLVKRARIKRNIQKNEAKIQCLKASLENAKMIERFFRSQL